MVVTTASDLARQDLIDPRPPSTNYSSRNCGEALTLNGDSLSINHGLNTTLRWMDHSSDEL